MKAILVIDEMPTRCLGCPCYYEDKGRCQNTWESVEDDLARPSWCPLKPLPDKIDQGYPCDTYDEGYGDGWDACIDEILGEQE